MSEDQTTEAVVGEGVAEAEEKATKKKAVSAKKSGGAMNKDELIEMIKQMTVIELSELVKALEEEFGVSAAAPVAVAAGPVGGAPAAEESGGAAEDEQTEFTVVLTSFGASKINVIKAVREVTALGLKEAKELVESAPKPVKEGVTKEEAANVKQKLEAVGATVEVK